MSASRVRAGDGIVTEATGGGRMPSFVRMAVISCAALAILAVGVNFFRSRTPGYITCTTGSVAPQVQAADMAKSDDFDTSSLLSLTEATSASIIQDSLLVVTTRHGSVVTVDNEGVAVEILDLSGRIMSDGYEQGLFDAAVSPEGDRIYFSFTEAEAGHLQVVEYSLTSGLTQLTGPRTVIEIEQPGNTHNGGGLAVDSDGHLWIGVGDGLAARLGQYRDWGNSRAAQDTSSLHGSVLRINPTPTQGMGYTVPADNPFVDSDDARSEIWAFGLRNPWRLSVDPSTGDLWVGDVGQHCWEEVNVLRAVSGAGANLGWPTLEGTHRYRGRVPGDTVLPVYEYGHGEGRVACSVVGGHIYRASKFPELQGQYLFSDSCAGRLWALSIDSETKVLDLGVHVPTAVSLTITPSGDVIVVSLTEGLFVLEAR